MGNNSMCPYKMKYVNKVQKLCGKIEICEGDLYNPINLKFHIGDYQGVSVMEIKDGFIDKISDLEDVIVVYKDNEIDTGFEYKMDEFMILEVCDDVYELRLVVESSVEVNAMNIWSGSV